MTNRGAMAGFDVNRALLGFGLTASLGFLAVDARLAIGAMVVVASARRFMPKRNNDTSHVWLSDREAIVGSRVALVEITSDDVDEYLGHLGAGFASVNGWSEDQLESHAADVRRPGAAESVLRGFALVREAETGQPFGFVGVQEPEPGAPDVSTVSWHLSAGDSVRADAVEAVALTIAALASAGYEAAHVVVQELNRPVRAVVDAAAFDLVRREKIFLPDGRLVPALRYSCLPQSQTGQGKDER